MPGMTAEGSAEILTRRAMRTPRAAAVAGLGFSMLLAASFVLIHLALPTDSETAGAWVTNASKRNAVLLGLNLLPFAGIAFLWFVGVMRDRIGAAEDRFFATVFLGSGLLFVAMVSPPEPSAVHSWRRRRPKLAAPPRLAASGHLGGECH